MRAHCLELKNSQSVGVFCVILSAVLFGCTALFTTAACNFGSNSYMAAFGRCSTATLILALIIALSPKLSFRMSLRQLGCLVILSSMFAGTMALLFRSYPLIGSGLGTTLHFTYPVDVIMIAMLFCHERPTRMKLFCAALCVAGVLCLYTPIEGKTLDNFGVFIALASGVTFALYVVGIGRCGLDNIPVLVTNFWLSFFSTIMTAIFALSTGTFVRNLGWQAWLAHAGLGFFISVMGTSLLQKGIFLCGSVKASLLSNLEPLTATLLGVLVFHETFTLRTGLGVICILAAAVLTSRK